VNPSQEPRLRSRGKLKHTFCVCVEGFGMRAPSNLHTWGLDRYMQGCQFLVRVSTSEFKQMRSTVGGKTTYKRVKRLQADEYSLVCEVLSREAGTPPCARQTETPRCDDGNSKD
jgi:hypothetical protein